MVFRALKKLLAFAVFRVRGRNTAHGSQKAERQKGTKIDWIPRKAEKLLERFHNPSFSAKNVEMGWLAAWMDAADLAGRLSEPRRAMYLQAVSTSTRTRQITAIHAPHDSTSPLPSTRRN